jgi:hypothetical protein
MIMNEELEKMWEEASAVCFKVLSLNLLGGTGDKQILSRTSWLPTTILSDNAKNMIQK